MLIIAAGYYPNASNERSSQGGRLLEDGHLFEQGADIITSVLQVMHKCEQRIYIEILPYGVKYRNLVCFGLQAPPRAESAESTLQT